jgi:hypothetical protein
MIKPAVLFIFFAFTTHISPAQDLASAYKPKNKTERLVIAKIRDLPEVRDFYKYIQRNKADFIINPPDPAYNNCYAMQVGIDYSDIFRIHFWLLIDPKTFQIYYEDFDDSGIDIITLREWRYWRKKPEFDQPHKWVRGKLMLVKTEKKALK